MCGYPYASPKFIKFTTKVMKELRDNCYSTSSDLAIEKGSFPLFDKDKYLQSGFIKTLPQDLKDKIAQQGIRNSHLLSIAPTGTISLTADNVSSGIEPPFALYYDRTIQNFDGHTVERVEDYAYRQGVHGRTANEITAEEHVAVLSLVSKYIDSAISKTCNVGDDVNYEKFKDLYLTAWKKGCRGITTFRAAGKRYGILNEIKEEPKAEACYIDPATGQKQCD
jgi:ribonucleoside-diphosphate reductase alpha chain